MSSNVIRAADITAAVDAAGLAGRPVCVHASLRSFGHVQGGAGEIVHGLLDAGSTVLVPTSSFRFCRAPKPAGTPPRPYNSEDDGSIPSADDSPTAGYATDATFLDPVMGAVPAAVLHEAGRRRGDHPVNSFAAIGPAADALIDPQTPFDVYAPLIELAHRGGAVVCMGVGLDTMTLLHLAEADAGLRLLHRWGRYADGTIVELRHGGCSRGFERLADAIADTERRHVVGTSVWRVFDAARLIEAASTQFRHDPAAGRCADSVCVRCRDQVAYGLRGA